jgi:hypothetical protein
MIGGEDIEFSFGLFLFLLQNGGIHFVNGCLHILGSHAYATRRCHLSQVTWF